MGRIDRVVRNARTNARRHGWWKAAYATLLRALGHQRWFFILRGHVLEEVDATLLRTTSACTGGFVARQQLGIFASHPAMGMSDAFLREALAKNDKCYAFTDQGAMIAYGWYATTPTRALPAFMLHFSQDYIYMYKGFTRESLRGNRLFPLGMMRALQHYRCAGYRGLLLYVDADNLNSLKSCARMGFRTFGFIVVARILGRYFVFESPGCRRFGFRLEQDWSEDARLRAPVVRIELPA